MNFLRNLFGGNKQKSETEIFTEAMAFLQEIGRWVEAHPNEMAAARTAEDAGFAELAAKRYARIDAAAAAREEIGYEAAPLAEARAALAAKSGDAAADAVHYARALSILLLSFCVSGPAYKRLSGPYSTLSKTIAGFAKRFRPILPEESVKTIERIGTNLIDAKLRYIGQPILTALGK